MAQRLATKYTRPMGSGMYATYHATLADGRVVTLDTQYSAVLPHEGHSDICPQLNVMGGRCDCPANADVMAMGEALLAEARTTGKAEVETSDAIKAARRRDEINRDNAEIGPTVHGVGWCERCGSYCWGDCVASSGAR